MELYLGFGLTQMDEINSGTTPYGVCPAQSIPCLLMLWWFYGPLHQKAWYWAPEPEASEEEKIYRVLLIYSYVFRSTLMFSDGFYCQLTWAITVFCLNSIFLTPWPHLDPPKGRFGATGHKLFPAYLWWQCIFQRYILGIRRNVHRKLQY